LTERAEPVAALRSVDVVTSFPELTLEVPLRLLPPDEHAQGTAYTVESVPERAVDLALGIALAICGDPKAHSSSALAAELPAELREPPQ
jgi:bifunctional ADP-heptose synthase (sugar kinase/adenylyltransferase)